MIIYYGYEVYIHILGAFGVLLYSMARKGIDDIEI